VFEEKRSLLEDSTVADWQNVGRKPDYGSGDRHVDLELVAFRKFCAGVAAKYGRLRRQFET